jgi:hypothetical protein
MLGAIEDPRDRPSNYLNPVRVRSSRIESWDAGLDDVIRPSRMSKRAAQMRRASLLERIAGCHGDVFQLEANKVTAGQRISEPTASRGPRVLLDIKLPQPLRRTAAA